MKQHLMIWGGSLQAGQWRQRVCLGRVRAIQLFLLGDFKERGHAGDTEETKQDQTKPFPKNWIYITHPTWQFFRACATWEGLHTKLHSKMFLENKTTTIVKCKVRIQLKSKFIKLQSILMQSLSATKQKKSLANAFNEIQNCFSVVSC